MPHKLSVNDFKWFEETSQIKKDFIKIYNEDSDIGYFIEADVQNSEKLHELHNDLPFLPEGMKIEKKNEKLLTNLHDKEGYIIHLRNLKQALKHGVVLKKCKMSLNLIKKHD